MPRAAPPWSMSRPSQRPSGSPSPAAGVDAAPKPATGRVAVRRGGVRMPRAALALIAAGTAAKGDVLGVARIAGIMAAKRTSDLIPLCHPLMLSKVTLDLTPAAPDA